MGVDVNLAENPPIEVAKEGDVWEKLSRFVDPESPAMLSPTAFFRYVACPLRFYFYSVARLKADDDLTEEVDAPMFGTILHAAAQRLYERIAGEEHPGGTLRALVGSGAVERAVAAAISSEYQQNEAADVKEYPGNLMLVHGIVSKYLRHGVVAYDAAHDGFRVEGLERPVEDSFPFVSAGRELRVRFGGIADRIDRLDDGRLRVVDYKTGESQLEFAGVEALFNGEAKQRQSNVLQTLLYAMMLTHSEGCEAVPALYYVRRMNRPDYSPELVDRCSIPPCRSARPTMRSTRAVIAITGRSAGDNYPIKIENDGRNDPLPPRPHVCDSVYCRELPAAVWCRRGYLPDRCGRTFPKKMILRLRASRRNRPLRCGVPLRCRRPNPRR